MAGKVWSTRFLLAGGGTTYAYVVPAGKRAVVKFAAAVNPTTGAQQAVMVIAGINAWVSSLPANTASNATGLHVVVNAGEELKMVTTATQMSVCVCGYLLDATTP